MLYYGMEAYKSQLKSLDFVINSAMRKMFYTKSQDVVGTCLVNCLPAESVIITIADVNFWVRLMCQKICYAVYLLLMP